MPGFVDVEGCGRVQGAAVALAVAVVALSPVVMVNFFFAVSKLRLLEPDPATEKD